MTIIYGIAGFIVGFLLGQWLLAALLKDKTKEELLNDPKLKDYGFISWGLALGFCALGVILAQVL